MAATYDEQHGIETPTNWDREKGLTKQLSEELRGPIRDFISDPSQHMAYLMTRRKDGREIMRPVSTFVEGWTVQTMTQDLQPKTNHVRRDPVVGYLWVGREPREEYPGNRWNPKVVWMQGRAELVTDQSEVDAFYARREKATGSGRQHPEGETLFLMRTTPEYVRAEGWAGMHAISFSDFSS
jgi:general stress protein 26